MAAAPVHLPETKFSRYRSVRRAQEQHLQQQPPLPAMPIPEPQKDAPVSRSMSRYHRQRPTVPGVSAQKTPPSPALPSSHAQPQPPVPAGPTINEHATPSRRRAPSSPAAQQQQRVRNGSNPYKSSPHTHKSPEPVPLVRKVAPEPPQSSREEARQLMQNEAERQKLMQAKLRAERRAKEEAERAENERLEKEAAEAEQLRIQKEALEREQVRQAREKELPERGRRLQKAGSASRLKALEEEESRRKYDEVARRGGIVREENISRPKTAPIRELSPPLSPSGHGRFGFFRRRKGEASPESSSSPGEVDVRNGLLDTRINLENENIKAGGLGVVAGVDAPVSAVNAGDRRILVECNKSSILLPVTPSTTAQDLIRSASTCLSEPIDPRASVLLESFIKVGLQRPLRKYEHVRDVLNSWDDDRQNSLVLVESATGGVDAELSGSSVPESRPEGMSCFIYYSQRPGKWAKRYITLRPDGQMVIAKSANERDTTNVCHLSDFDIYSPTKKKLAKAIKPPKKICFAIKSQQKSSMFLDETMFVHFFCTSDPNIGTMFYKAIQGWRSWYLMNVMGEGQKQSNPTETVVANGGTRSRNVSGSNGASTVAAAALHARNISRDSHYQLGSFKPLLDLGQFSKETERDVGLGIPSSAAVEVIKALDSKALHARKMSGRVRGPPAVTYNASHGATESASQQRAHSDSFDSHSGAEETFAPTGLLGRNYTQKQRQMQERDKITGPFTGPFTEGPSLLNGGLAHDSSGLGRKSSVRSTHRRHSSDLNRGGSVRIPGGKPKPLVDLTPQFREPPQHANKGKGFYAEPGQGPLIENATSQDDPFNIPPATDWRRPTTSAGPRSPGTYGSGGAERTRTMRGQHPTEGLAGYALNKNPAVANDETAAFTGAGLLAQAGLSQGSMPVGHGIMDGSKAKGPMMDLSEQSRFAPGSLLAGVEMVHGPANPVIDRQKRREAAVPTGEGL